MDKTKPLSIAETRTYTISELAREFEVTPRALRFYEDKDMLHPARDGMMRVYSNRDRARLKIILQCKRVGLPLAEIRDILDLYDLGDGQRAQMREALNKFTKQRQRLLRQREDIEAAMIQIDKGIDWLEQQLDHIGPGEEEARNLAAYERVARAHLDAS